MVEYYFDGFKFIIAIWHIDKYFFCLFAKFNQFFCIN